MLYLYRYVRIEYIQKEYMEALDITLYACPLKNHDNHSFIFRCACLNQYGHSSKNRNLGVTQLKSLLRLCKNL